MGYSIGELINASHVKTEPTGYDALKLKVMERASEIRRSLVSLTSDIRRAEKDRGGDAPASFYAKRRVVKAKLERIDRLVQQGKVMDALNVIEST